MCEGSGEQGAQFIICLSHGGTNVKESKSEDQQLAKKVDGIDLIISGHTHTTLTEPIVEGDTYIVSAGPYCENLGSITLEWTEDGEKTLKDYHLTPIDETVAEDQTIATLVEGWKNQVSSSYLASYGLSYDQVLTTSDYDLPKPQNKDRVDNALGNLVARCLPLGLHHTGGRRPRCGDGGGGGRRGAAGLSLQGEYYHLPGL